MATYIVTQVHKEFAPDRRHRHIIGVCTDDGVYYRRLDVVDSIRAGNAWRTRTSGHEAKIEVVSFCPHRLCMASPYIQTHADATGQDYLDQLDEC